jgi:Zn-dependent peptidase ImmA (M78 family)
MKMQGNNPVMAAKRICLQLGWQDPSDFTLEEVSNALGVIVMDVPIKGSEGRILMKGDTGIISLNSSINHPGKRNFVIAHELGHFVLHKNLMPLFSDTHKTLSEWHKKGLHEQQANEFASELLMPTEIFKGKVAGKKLNINLIEEVASYFDVSLTAAFIKYAAFGSYPLMVIFIEDKLSSGNNVPFKYLPLHSAVPAWTVAGDFFKTNKVEPYPEKVDAIEWFPDDFQIKYKQDWKLWEQCYQIAENGLISCLWTF